VLATVAETGLGLSLLAGLRIRPVSLAAAALLLTYAVAMTISVPPAEQFHYSVFLLCAGMLALASVGKSPLSVDSLIDRLRMSRVRPARPLAL